MDITKLKTLPEQVLENTKQLNEEIIPTVEAAVTEANKALSEVAQYNERISTTEDKVRVLENEMGETMAELGQVVNIANDAKETAEVASGLATGAQSTADSAAIIANEALAGLTTTNATVLAHGAQIEANTAAIQVNKEAIESLGDLDAEAIAGLSDKVSANTGDITTIKAQVQSLNTSDINIKADITELEAKVDSLPMPEYEDLTSQLANLPSGVTATFLRYGRVYYLQIRTNVAYETRTEFKNVIPTEHRYRNGLTAVLAKYTSSVGEIIGEIGLDVTGDVSIRSVTSAYASAFFTWIE